MAKIDLYKYSGHYDKYPERFEVTSAETDDVFMLKPMNCPHHVQLYKSRPRSYRDLPLRFMENTTNYRDEKSGELHGLSRVRSLSQDDGHSFARFDQVETEIINIVTIINDLYDSLGMSFYANLSFRDESDKYLGERETWQRAEQILKDVVAKTELDHIVTPGEAAFYGPKIDFMVKDALGREWQCATVQLDFVQPERFDLAYVAGDGTRQRPVMIHKALLGSIERFLSVYIEHTAGRFPVWLAPEQLRIIQVKDTVEVIDFVEQLAKKARESGLRVTVDDTNESVGKKIRAAEVLKVPYALVIGDKEVQSGMVSPRVRGDLAVVGGAERSYSIEQLLASITNEARGRASKSSL